jgi:hypothetical protein
VTSHRLIQSQSGDLLAQLPGLADPIQLAREVGELPRWFAAGLPMGVAVSAWEQRWPGPAAGWRIVCCLEIERAANGVLAHLSVAPAGRPLPLSAALSNWLLRACSARLLGRLAAEAEAACEASNAAARATRPPCLPRGWPRSRYLRELRAG